MYRDDIGGSTGYKAQRSPSPEHAEDVQHDRRTCVTWESGVRETFRCGVTDRQPYPTTVIGVSRALRAIPKLSEFLNANVVRSSAGIAPEHLAAVLAWGHRPSARAAERLAQERGLPVWRLEDGFLRSVRLGREDPPCSLMIDDLGIYYDATGPSRLESFINAPHGAAQTRRASRLVDEWRAGRVSKYNHARELNEGLPERFVLVVDQTFGDASIRYGLAEPSSFTRMLDAALDEYPKCTVVLKVHPEVFSGRKRGHFERLTSGQAGRVLIWSRDVHPPSLLEGAEAVYAVTSQMGFEGLIWGKPVRTFGMPFYAGWGLTRDELATPPRRREVSLPDLVHAALVEYPRYVDPETGRRCTVERVLEHLALQRRMRERFPEQVYAVRFSYWKKPIVRAFFQGSEVRFVRRRDQVPAGATVTMWGPLPSIAVRKSKKEASYSRAWCHPERDATTRDLPYQVIGLEDGFLRSVGLGADLVRPLSWVMDARGVYYDATRPSDLEKILLTTDFDSTLLVRAGQIRERIVTEGLTKYNVGETLWRRPASRGQVILVPGQVESDASIRFGAPGICRNVDLLQAVRKAAPQAWIIYKPHPDVVAGLRRKGKGENEAGRWCNEIVTDVAMGTLLETVDEVHVMTSLAGFEALLRGKAVTCYGQPFYAGWGLTTDVLPIARRSRKLTLDELTAGVLILYPTYVSRVTGCFTTPERALDELLEWRKHEDGTIQMWRRIWRWAMKMGLGK